jgi:hypothetical protein
MHKLLLMMLGQAVSNPEQAPLWLEPSGKEQEEPVMLERRTRPATAEDFHRLANLAHARGLRLFRDGPRWYCSSASQPGEAHYVTGFSCTCPGFIAHQRCTHHALLLERLAWLPEVEGEAPDDSFESLGQENGRVHAEPPLASAANGSADCPSCSGCGVVVYRSFEERCPACGGSGIRPDHRLTGTPAVPMVAAAA